MLKFIHKYFLVFPKLMLSNLSGIALSEIFLIIQYIYNPKKYRNIFIPFEIKIFYIFIFSLLILSSFSFLLFNPLTFPNISILYFCKYLIYYFIFHYFYNNYYKISETFFLKPFLIHFFLSLFIYISYRYSHTIKINDLIWTTKVGYKLLPLIGTAINLDSEYFIEVIGGGSGNIFFSWGFFIIILVKTFHYKYRHYFYLIGFLIPILALSRGGILTIIIYFVFKLSNYKKIIFLIILFLSIFFLSNTTKDNIGIYTRIINTFQNNKLDPSSRNRLSNYSIVYNQYTSNIRSIFLGIGFEKSILKSLTNQNLVESFFLTVLFQGGLVSLFFLFLFFLFIFNKRNTNKWFYILSQFIFYQSILNWTITGGDFLSPVTLYIVFSLLGLAYGTQKNITFNTNC